MENEKYLPLGSVVILKGASHCMSIAGFCFTLKDKPDRQYDYIGVPYPEGYMGDKTLMYFDHDNIDKVFAVGYSNDTEKSFKEKLNKTVSQICVDKAAHQIDQKKLEEFLKQRLEENGK